MDNHGSATLAPGYEEHAGLTLAEAATNLGISKDAARRRLKSGKLSGHQILGAHGPEWCCHLEPSGADRHGSATPAPTVAPPLDNPGATVAQPADVAALVGIVDRLTVENGELRNEANLWKSQALVLAVQLTQAQEQLAIAAPADSPVVGQPEPQPVNVTVDTRSTPRWRRWWLLALAVVVAVVVVALLVWPR